MCSLQWCPKVRSMCVTQFIMIAIECHEIWGQNPWKWKWGTEWHVTGRTYGLFTGKTCIICTPSQVCVLPLSKANSLMTQPCCETSCNRKLQCLHRFVDKSDRMPDNYGIARRTWKWTNKLFSHLTNMALLNALPVVISHTQVIVHNLIIHPHKENVMASGASRSIPSPFKSQLHGLEVKHSQH